MRILKKEKATEKISRVRKDEEASEIRGKATHDSTLTPQ